jgi:nitroalkane oxidase
VSVVAIDFTLSDSQQELQKNARAFAEGVLRPVAGQIDRAADGWESFLAGREAYREMAHAGFTKSFIPAEYGGAGFSMLDLAIAAEELTCVDVNVPTTLLATGLGLQPVMVFPLYDGANQGVRRRQLHDIMRDPGYDSMLAARGEGLPGDW